MKSVWEYARKYEQKFVNFNSHAQSIFGWINYMILKHFENPVNKESIYSSSDESFKWFILYDSYSMIHDWQNLENSSRNYSEISVFRGVPQTLSLENSFFFSKFLFWGHDKDLITGKLIHLSILEFFGMTEAVSLENSSKTKHLVENIISWMQGRDTGRINGKLILTILNQKFAWMSFPVKQFC